MTDYKLTYFDVKGLAEPIRILFSLAKVPFEDVRLPYTPGVPGVIPPEIKAKLPFGQVPAVEFDGHVLSQSATIARFLAKRFNLLGANELEAARIDEINDALKDYQDTWKPVWYSKTEEEKAAAIKTAAAGAAKYLDKFSEILESNGTGFLVGKSVSLVDITVSYFFNYVGAVNEVDLIKDHPVIQAHVKRVESIPAIAEYLEKRPKSIR